MILSELSRPQVEQLDRDKTVVVVPLASLEQHGLHLPVFTDSIIGEAIATRVEGSLPDDVLLLPTQWLGSSHHHLTFPGTMSVPSELYIEMVVELCKCIIAAGFKRVYLLLSHGGNDVPCREAIQRLALKYRDRHDLWLTSAGWWALAKDVIRFPEMETERPTHACEYETSLILALRPELVDMEKAEGHVIDVNANCFRPDSSGGFDVGLSLPFEQLTRTGAMGRPEFASAEKGEKLLAAIVGKLVEYVQDFATWEREAL